MTELEKLRKHMKYFRAFARNVKTIAFDSDPHNKKKRLIAIANLVSTYENQWPNWLDDGIESKEDSSCAS